MYMRRNQSKVIETCNQLTQKKSFRDEIKDYLGKKQQIVVAKLRKEAIPHDIYSQKKNVII
jgi:hypothetical protein